MKSQTSVSACGSRVAITALVLLALGVLFVLEFPDSPPPHFSQGESEAGHSRDSSAKDGRKAEAGREAGGVGSIRSPVKDTGGQVVGGAADGVLLVQCHSRNGEPISWKEGQACSVVVYPAVDGGSSISSEGSRIEAQPRYDGGVLELIVPKNMAPGACRLAVIVPNYAVSVTDCMGPTCSVTLVRSASIEIEIQGLPDSFLDGNDVTFEFSPEDPTIAGPDRWTFSDGSFVNVPKRIVEVRGRRQKIEGLIENFRYTGCLKENQGHAILAENHFVAPQTVSVQATCKGYLRVLCTRDVDGVLTVADRIRTPLSWYQAVPIVSGRGWLRVRHELTDEAGLLAWGHDWNGEISLEATSISVKTLAGRNYRILLDSEDDYEVYQVVDGAVRSLNPWRGDWPVTACRSGDYFQVRGASPGQRILVRNAERSILSLVTLPQGTSDIALEPEEERAWGVIRNGPQVFRSALRAYPANVFFGVVAVFELDGETFQQILRLHTLNAQNLERLVQTSAWRLPQLPRGGRYVAVIRESARKELGRFDLEWAQAK